MSYLRCMKIKLSIYLTLNDDICLINFEINFNFYITKKTIILIGYDQIINFHAIHLRVHV